MDRYRVHDQGEPVNVKCECACGYFRSLLEENHVATTNYALQVSKPIRRARELKEAANVERRHARPPQW